MRDPYKVLGLSRSASQDDIKTAYRKLARQNHPDLHQGDARAEERFKEIQSAYQLLSDEDKRIQFDRGQIDAEGNPTFRSGGFAGGGRRRGGAGGGAGADFHDIFRDFANQARGGGSRGGGPFGGGGFGGGFGSGGFGGFGGDETHPQQKGATVNCWLELDFSEAARGCKKTVRLPTGKELSVNVPAGFEDGQSLRLKGQGMPGLNGAPSGDAMVEIHIKPDPNFSRKGNDIHLDLPITVPEAVMGAKIEAPTIDGAVNVKVPENANSGTTLRLRGKGIKGKDGKQGDQYVKLRVMLPEKSDKEFADFVKKWSKKNPYSVRAKKS
ncbi:DnaJ C-terminal domain-containing protein [Terasakiella sp. A23]|uniref:DnaJ C-terminal domain-containing protein n=1 Tax=Terasakiella sp. FCG-A23 TaxID=3080561 RepID=UPI00295495D3|nr:DnaJ C-terminal domain-containing protein [Terasakiella sp. A23]MDV7340114.1 DnaJ C-terminal domain-containing protein [Terasakiella sp. A23]